MGTVEQLSHKSTPFCCFFVLMHNLLPPARSFIIIGGEATLTFCLLPIYVEARGKVTRDTTLLSFLLPAMLLASAVVPEK